MSSRDISCVSVFYSFNEARTWIDEVLDEECNDSNHPAEVVIKIMPGGSYRAGVIIRDNQQDIFKDA